MSNKALACFGIGAYILSVLSSATDVDGNSIASMPLIAVSVIATIAFVICAPIRLWRKSRGVSLVFMCSAVVSVVCESVQYVAQPEYGSPIIIASNIFRVAWLVACIAAVITLFKTSHQQEAISAMERHQRWLARLCTVITLVVIGVAMIAADVVLRAVGVENTLIRTLLIPELGLMLVGIVTFPLMLICVAIMFAYNQFAEAWHDLRRASKVTRIAATTANELRRRPDYGGETAAIPLETLETERAILSMVDDYAIQIALCDDEAKRQRQIQRVAKQFEKSAAECLDLEGYLINTVAALR